MLAATGVSGYLSVVRVIGEDAVCGPSRGCETVASSEYSEIFGIPVAFLGLAFSLVLVVLAATWWRRADRRVLLAAYALLLLGTLFVAYLTYLELFVIEAICVWCVAFAITVVVALVISGLAMHRSSRPAAGQRVGG
ncbi:MAG TPA: vitamin K epoxide reductase family protein [Candidatus Limnocylindrales bacterium]|nr:vitamin K epoxide reductase family protein [Candidatus Limnocylindrales bacterium]